MSKIGHIDKKTELWFHKTMDKSKIEIKAGQGKCLQTTCPNPVLHAGRRLPSLHSPKATPRLPAKKERIEEIARVIGTLLSFYVIASLCYRITTAKGWTAVLGFILVLIFCAFSFFLGTYERECDYRHKGD